MTIFRTLFRLALGKRLPITVGEIRTPGISSPVTIRRDQWGIPHIDANSLTDAAFGLGFCQAQDRGFQLETSLRFGRGTLAELVGEAGLPVDRVSRRIGFRRAAEKQVAVLDADVRAQLAAFAAGVTAGFAHGLTRKPHEFSVLGGEPTPWETADVLAYLKVLSFLLPSNWDVEMARLRILRADGPNAVRDLDPVGGVIQNPSPPPPPRSGEGEQSLFSSSPLRFGEGPGEGLPFAPDALSLLLADLAAVQKYAPGGGGSNNWVIAGSRTVSGKPLLASDPHLAPTLPPPWYLAHVRTPEGSVAGATFAGAPAFPIGHNGFACWGVTAGLTDNTDLFLETLGPGGGSVRTADGSFLPCEVVRETILVKGRPEVVEDVLVTPRGPVISPVIPGVSEAISIRAVWLDSLPVRGFVDAPKATDFESFRTPFAAWPVLPLNVVYADSAGTIGRQLVGQLPVRKGGHGLMPRPADRADSGWDGYVPFEDMPVEIDPPGGIIATANNPPESPAAYLGHDFVDRYRVTVIREELGSSPVGWTVADFLKLQRNVRSKPWEELRDSVLSLTAKGRVQTALDLLRAWDGNVSADSPAAAVFELFVAEMSCRIARAKAPNSWKEAVGGDGTGPMAHNLFSDRRVEHLVRLVHAKPDGWFTTGWEAEMTAALEAAVETLTRTRGPAPRWWTWGDARPLVLRHTVLGKSRLLGAIFNRGPVPCGGDQNTVSQAGVRPLDPLAPTHNMANLRAVFDPSDWSNSRFVLAGGQSGNPTSPHADDLFALWQRGDAIPIPWTPDEVLRAAVATLRLVPDMEKPQVSPGF